VEAKKPRDTKKPPQGRGETALGGTSALTFVVLVGGVYACYMGFGVYQEKIYVAVYDGESFTWTSTLLFVQCVANAIMALMVLRWSGTSLAFNMSPLAFALPGFTYIAAMYCSNEALKFVSYPTQVLAKSCKPIPVMFMGMLFFRKRYSVSQMINVGLITVGIALFLLKPSKGNDGQDAIEGLVLLAASLLFDGFTGSLQEKIFRTSKAHPGHSMFFFNAWSSLYLFIFAIFSGDLIPAFSFMMRHPEILFDLSVFIVASCIGQLCIHSLVHAYGALVLTLVTTTRKFFTILFSVLVFGHALTTMQWVGVAVVFAALMAESLFSRLRR